MLRVIFFASLAFVCSLAIPAYANEAALKKPIPKKPAELFNETAVWDIHLKFTAEQWAAMEPKGAGFGGGPGGGRGGFRGPSFKPSPMLAPAMLHFGSANDQGKLSRDAFTTLAGKWFSSWDKDASGAVDGNELRDGLNSVIPPRAAGMNLQGPEGGRNGIAAAFGIEYAYVHADLEFEGQVFKDVAVRYKGGGTFLDSRNSMKRPLKVSLNEYVKGQKLAGISTLNLSNGVTDATQMNEVLSHRLYREAGVPAPRTAYARVCVTVAGKHERQYLGLYTIVENVDKNFAEEALGTRKGALFKPVTPNLFADLGSDWKHYNQTYDPKGDPSDTQLRRVIDLCRLVTYADDAEFASRIADYIELEKLSRFMAVMVFLSDVDGILGPGQNFYLHLHPDTNKFTFIPWDQDRSFGNFPMRGTQEQREQLSTHRPWDGQNRFLERLYKVESFKKAYLARLDEFSTTIFRPERFDQQMELIAAAIRPAVREESAEKLARFEKAVAGETAAQAGGGFNFGAPPKPVKPFVRIRIQSVVDQLAGKSEGMQMGSGRPGGAVGRGGPGGPGGGTNATVASAFLAALDSDKNGGLTREEFIGGFGRWFDGWNTDKSGRLSEDQLRVGLDKDLVARP
jgi:spore coat protein H